MVGDVTVTLYAATSARDTDWTARLCEVYPDGRSINLQEGIVRARYRDSLSEPSLLEPDRVYCYDIPLGPVGVRIACREPAARHHGEQRFPAVGPQPQHGRNPLPGTCQRRRGCDPTVLHNAQYASHLTVHATRRL